VLCSELAAFRVMGRLITGLLRAQSLSEAAGVINPGLDHIASMIQSRAKVQSRIGIEHRSAAHQVFINFVRAAAWLNRSIPRTARVALPPAPF
jgi:hypothetical protein